MNMKSLSVKILKLRGYDEGYAAQLVKCKMVSGPIHAMLVKKPMTDDEYRKMLCHRPDYRRRLKAIKAAIHRGNIS